MSVRRARGETLVVAAGSPVVASKAEKVSPDHSGVLRPAPRVYDLYFPAMLGPTRTKTRRGVRVKLRSMELPPNANDRLHFRVKGPWVKAWRTEAWAAARRRQIPRLERVRVSMVLFRTRLGVADPDGDWQRVKPLLDGLRDAKVLPNDTHKHVTLGTIEEKRGPELGLLLILEEMT